MENNRLANLANYNSKRCNSNETKNEEKRRLSLALNTLSELLNIEFGSLTIHFHQGKWCPKIEIQKNVMKEINEN